jgi:hypothetical protein
MTKRNCRKKHYCDWESSCIAERFVLFHNTRFRIALSYHEWFCPHCGYRYDWFINR